MTRIVTRAESSALAEFRSRIPDILAELTEFQRQDLWLLRWLRDKELKVDRAEKMLRNTILWRKENHVDLIFTIPIPEYIDKNYICRIPGFDRKGHVLAIYNFGQWDLKKVIRKGLQDGHTNYIIQFLETSLNVMQLATPKDEFCFKFSLILDFDGFSISQVASREVIELLIEFFDLLRSHYPETLNSAWIVNIPSFFDVLFRIMEPFIPAKTLARAHIHGREGWREKLLKEFDAEDLPSNYGGANTTCPEYRVRNGFDYAINKYETFHETEFSWDVLGPGEKLPFSHHLLTGHRMSWNFRSDDVDVGYVVQFQKELTDKPRILFECAHADSHLHLQKGGIMATEPGIYSLILDNCDNFINKNIYYAIRIDTDIRKVPPWALSVEQIRNMLRVRSLRERAKLMYK